MDNLHRHSTEPLENLSRTPSNEGIGLVRKDSASENVNSTSEHDNNSAPPSDRTFPTTKPLPPISTEDDTMSEDGSVKSNGKTLPKIVAYKREISVDRDGGPSEYSMVQAHRKSFSSASKKATGKRVSLTGKEVVTVTMETQTDWTFADDGNFLEDLKLLQRQGQIQRISHRSIRSADSSESDDTLSENEDDLEGSRQSHSVLSYKSRDAKQDAVTEEPTELAMPFPNRDDEYGIPFSVDTDSDFSSDDDFDYYPEDVEPGKSLPSVGPPQILQYQRESEKVETAVDQAFMDHESSHHVVTEEELQALRTTHAGIFHGKCEFCSQSIKPFPSIEQQKTVPPERLYCCGEYKEFVDYVASLQHDADKIHRMKTKKIDVKPHAPYGSKQARSLAKERAAQRMRERELARQQAMVSTLVGGGGTGSGGGGGGAAGATNFYQFNRQMKTINYMLSSQRCMDEGWTLRVPSPLADEPDRDIFEPEAVWPAWAEAMVKRRDTPDFVQKFYSNGSLYLCLFRDSTGTVYYPSGRPAITISSTELGRYTYIIRDDSEQAHTLSVFDSAGHASAHFDTGALRLYMDQMGGVELDPAGTRRRKWLWKEQVTHVHAPPIQPITFQLSSSIAIRVMSQDNITLTYTCRSYSCRFQVGAKLRLISPDKTFPVETDEYKNFLDDTRTRAETVIQRVSNLLKFSRSPKLENMPAPGHLSARVTRGERRREQSDLQRSRDPPASALRASQS